MSSSDKHVIERESSGLSWYLSSALKCIVNVLNENPEEMETTISGENECPDTTTTQLETECNMRPNLPNETLFHAVLIPMEYRDSTDSEDVLHVYSDMQDALQVIKSNNKGRLKTFKNHSDAIAYARTGYEQLLDKHPIAISAVAPISEKTSNFMAPTIQELIIFKRLIEDGNLEHIEDIIWGNPRYLISSGNTPAILQMGYRYNALHIAAKNDKPRICELILDTVGDPKFIQWHYGEDECKTYLDPAQIMQDLYLNTPDKGLNETPLHFAVKFGYKNVVQVLVSYSQCIKTLPNKYKQLPIDLICSRKCQEDENLKREIRLLLEDQFYVPVLRSEGNACPPIIGEPFSPTSPLSLDRDFMSPRLEVRAFAGPMNKTQATEFRKKWKTPPRITPKKGQGDASSIMNSPSIAMKLQDTEKGLERVGRDLAEEYQVPWKEYWPFLKDFVDFRCEEGLMKLEKRLEKRYKEASEKWIYERLRYCVMKKNQLKNLTNKMNVDGVTSCQQTQETMDNDVQYLCDKLNSLDTNSDKIEDADSLEFFTPPSSPNSSQNNSDDEMDIAEEEGPLIFIEGSLPTKLDYAVYNALSSMISSDTFPYVYRWRHDMKLIIKRDPHRFNDTKCLKRKLFINN